MVWKEEGEMIRVREYDKERDLWKVEEMERSCEIGHSGSETSSKKSTKKKKKKSMKLFVDLLGDPMSRVRHTPLHVMMVAEYEEKEKEKKEIVGVIRACIKMVTRGRKPVNEHPIYAKVAYILGLRVSPSHRRNGIGTKLVEAVESWCRKNGAEYSYMATERSNTASLNLFTKKFSYSHFRSPAMLVHPVHHHSLPLPLHHDSLSIFHIPPSLATSLYNQIFKSNSEFYPSDIFSVLSNPLTITTLIALPSSDVAWQPCSLLRGLLPRSYAVLSLWNSSGVFRMRVGGAPVLARAVLGVARALDERAPWMRLPALKDVFRPFGVYFMYGLHMEGEGGDRLMTSLCRVAHNIASKDDRCAALVAEVGPEDPVRVAVPRWRRFSCEEDLWCVKRLGGGGGGDDVGDDNWVKSPPSTDVIFVDPREF
ncbi:putative aminoglycoside 6'-N-acetyltransferase transcription regulator GNAT family [Dioscorea sansibarensis]